MRRTGKRRTMNKPMIRPCPVCGTVPMAQVWQFEGKTLGARIFCPRTACGLPYYAEGDTLEDAAKRWNEFTIEDSYSMTAYLRSLWLQRMKNELEGMKDEEKDA